MALDATPKSPTANAYITESFATAYLDQNRLYDSTWVAASTADRESAIIWATFLIDVGFDFNGAKRTIEQALRFPRSGLLDADGNNVDYDTIPVLVQRATAELALFLIQRDPSAQPSILGKGISHVTLGPISIDASLQQILDLIPRYVIAVLEPFGSLKGSATFSGARQMRLIRV